MIVTPLPQANGIVKNRPALVLRAMPPFQDLLVCGVSTQLHQEAEGFDEIVATTDADFKASGLKQESLIRLGFLTLIPRTKIIGSIGSIAAERHKRLSKNLSDYLIQ